jgi:hypothetical protein
MRDLAVPGRRLRIYGGMLNLLAAEGDFASILQVEHSWNPLAGELVFTLLCGYFAEHLGAPRSSDALRRFCEAHSEVRTQPADLPGSFLLQASRWVEISAGAGRGSGTRHPTRVAATPKKS